MEAFYTIKNILEEEMTQVFVEVNPNHPIYQAHFPGNPITPGAMMVRMAAEIVASSMGIDRDLTEVKNVKFLQPHQPHQQPHLTFVFKGGALPVDVDVYQDGVTYSKMTLIF